MSTGGPSRPDPVLAAVEAYFLRSGLPHLAVGYDARSDTLARLRGALLVLMGIGFTVVVRPDWPLWVRVLVALAAVVVVLGVLAVANLLRRRPPLVRPERVGFLEASAIVLAPAALDLVTGDDPARAGLIAAVSVGIALVFYALTSMGILAMFLGLGRSALDGLIDTASVALRAMPPVLAVLLFLFLATEVWQAFGLAEGWRFGGIMALFALLSTGFILSGLRRERDAFVRPDDRAGQRRRALATPAAPLVESGVVPLSPPLPPLARFNLVAALLASVGARVIAVGVAIAVFFVVFGLLAVDLALTAQWTGQADPNVLLSVGVGGRELVLTEALVRLSILLGGFAALYFSVAAVGERRNREEFLEDEIERVGRVMAAWTYYRGALARTAGPAGGPTSGAPPRPPHAPPGSAPPPRTPG